MRRLCFRARSVFAFALAFAPAFAVTSSLTACASTSQSSSTGSQRVGGGRSPNAVVAYVAYVASEASDVVTRIRFVPGTDAIVERITRVGEPGRIVGPHGIALSKDGAHWFVSLSHGVPTGRVARYSTSTDTLTRRVNVGLFPETIESDGDYIYVTNSDMTGGNAVSSVSILFAPTMTEVARPATCVKPQGGRIALDSRHYSVCETSDQLVVIDTKTLQVSHRFSLTPGQERLVDINSRGTGRRGARGCAPTWAEPGKGLRRGYVYVACGRSNEVVEIDARSWSVTRRIATNAAPHRIASDSTGLRLYVTLAQDSAVLPIDLANGAQGQRISTTQASPHSIIVTPDNRYVFVSNEGSGSARGTVDIIDVSTMRRVSSVAVGYGAGAMDVMQIRMVRQ